MTHPDDHQKSGSKETKSPSNQPALDDEVHSSATLDFDELTTSNAEMPKVVPPSRPIQVPRPSAEVGQPIDLERKQQLAPIEEAPSTPMERVTFSNLEALVPERPAAPVPEKAAPKPVERRTTIHDVKPPSFRRFILIAVAIILGGIIVLFGSRIEWDLKLVQTDPALAINVALGLQTKPKPVLPKRNAIVQTESITGEIRALDLVLERAGSGPMKGRLVLRGRLENGTNRIQSKVMLRASLLTSGGLAIESKRGLCCTMEDAPKSKDSVAHGSITKPVTTIMKPGDVKYFSFVFSKKNGRSKSIKPKVEVVFSEAERIR